MSLSIQRAVSDGSLVLLPLSIDYFDRSDITVLFGGIVRAPGNGWNWVGATAKQISFNPAIAAGVEVTAKRNTPMDLPRHEYTQGAQFVAETLDENFKQVLRIAQEAKETGALAEVFNDLDMHGFKLRNVGPATEPNDAVSLAQYQADAAGANQSKIAAAASAAAAAQDRATAVSSANTAVAQAALADQDRLDAAAHAAAALASKNAAGTSATNAATSEANALSSKNSASTSLSQFQNQYQGPKAAAPATRTDNSALQIGDLYFDTSTGMRVYTATGWASAGSSVNGTAKRGSITATAGQTVFPIPGGFDSGFIDVYLDGAKLVNGNDVTVTASPNVTLAIGALAGQTLDYVAYGTFSVADTYNQATIDAKVNNQQYRNRLMNGALNVDQRNAVSETNVAANATGWVGDRWGCYSTVGNRINVSKPAISDLPGFQWSMLFYSGAQASIAAADQITVKQVIEGYNVADSLWGSAQARPAVLSFWAKAINGGTFSGSIRNGALNRSFVFQFALPAGTWTYVTVPVPGCTDGVWATDNTWGIGITFNLGSGSNVLVSNTGAWQGLNAVGVTGSTSVTTVGAGSLRLAGLQFEFGSVATPFEFRPYSAELAMCQRYYERVWFRLDTQTAASAVFCSTMIRWAVDKRIQPAVTREGETVSNCIYNSPGINGVTGAAMIYAPGSSAGYALATAVASAEL